jgi:hypothetical protein
MVLAGTDLGMQFSESDEIGKEQSKEKRSFAG